MTQASRRAILKNMAAAGAFATGGGLAVSQSRAATRAEIAKIADTCQPLSGLSFDAEEQQQALSAIDEIVDRARTIAALSLENDLPPAELFDPRLPDWRPAKNMSPEASPPVLPPLPATGEDIAFAPAWQQSGWIGNGKLTSGELTEIYLDRIAVRAGRLNCFVTLLHDEARAVAAERDREMARGICRGSLHGLPYGLKDLIDTAGVRTTWGGEPYRNRVPSRDATIVERLHEAGAVLLGKTSCGAIAYGDRWYGGQTRNPWNVEEGSSGSSSGSAAAVADGLCAFAIGTETMGSIVAPAARCGTVGLRPTFGRVPRTGTMALCWSLDKIGVLARNVRDTVEVLRVLNGPDSKDACAIAAPLAPVPEIDPGQVRLGYRSEWFASGPDTDRAVLRAAQEAGFQMTEIDLPALDLAPLGGIVVLEAAAAFEELTATGMDEKLVWQEDIAWPNSWRAAHFETAVNYIQAQRQRRRLMEEFAEVMGGVDAILHPNNAGGLLIIGNHCGYPGLVFPAGFVDQPTRKGFTAFVPATDAAADAQVKSVPFTATLTGHLFDEARLTAIGGVLTQALALPARHPPA